MSYTANNNNRSIPTVGTSCSRRPPTPRSTTSALERKLEETVKDLEEMRRSFGEQQVQLNHLSVEHEELKAKLNNKSTKETNFSFPSFQSMVFNHQITVMGTSTWDVEEKLMTGETNGEYVRQIVSKTLTDGAYRELMRGYVWPSSEATKFIKRLLSNQYNYQKARNAKAALSANDQEALSRQGLFRCRKSLILSRRKDVYESHKEELLNIYGSHTECQQVLITEMISDQEDEYDEQGLVFRSKKVPHYRKQKCTDFFDKLDVLRINDNQRMNSSFQPTRTGSRVTKVVHIKKAKKLQELPAWAIDHGLL